MTQTVSQETETSKTYLLGFDGMGRQIVSIHVKKMYQLMDDGTCAGGPGEQPLLLGNAEAGETEFNETDVIPFKQNTDLIVMSQAWARGKTSVVAGIRVEELTLRYQVFGDRRVVYHGPGSWRFGSPEPFESIDMCYTHAYGGFDETVPDPKVEYLIDMMEPHPGMYPRNPCGKGYVVYPNKERIDGLLLPNIEHPGMLLTPQNLVVKGSENWWRAPLPWSCGWFEKTFYPRILYYRGAPEHLPAEDAELPEVQLGWLDAGYGLDVPGLEEDHPYDYRICDAASPALVMPTMRGDERIELTNMTPDGHMVVQLPSDRPHVSVQYKGKREEVPVVPHRILISTLEGGVYIVWHAAWYPPRFLPERGFRPGASLAAAVAGVDVFVDGHAITPLGAEDA